MAHPKKDHYNLLSGCHQDAGGLFQSCNIERDVIISGHHVDPTFQWAIDLLFGHRYKRLEVVT